MTLFMPPWAGSMLGYFVKNADSEIVVGAYSWRDLPPRAV